MKTVKLDNVPAALTARPQWCVWKTTTRGGKPTKVPYQTTGTEAKSNDPSTWATFEEVSKRHRAGGYTGPGFVFSADDPFVGIDLDGCRDPKTGEVAEWAREVISKLNSYAEVSPSQTGVKVFARGESPFATGKKKDLDEPVVVADKKPGIEIYSHGRYFAVTGWRLAGVSHEVETRDLAWLKERFWPEVNRATPDLPKSPSATSDVTDRARQYMARLPSAVSGESGHNATFHVACVLVLGFGLSQDEAMQLMREYNARCQPAWTERELLHKVQSATEQPGERNYLRDATPDQWKRINVPSYGAKLEEPAKTRRTTLEAATNKYLQYVQDDKARLLSLGLPDVDYAVGGGVAPGEVIIIAGRPSHGKSAVAMQCLHSLTADGLATVCISEEMSALALGKRVLHFASDVSEEHWKTSVPLVTRQVENHFEKRAECRVVESCGTAEAAAEEIRRAVKEIDAEVAVIDYAQLLASGRNSEYEEVTKTSKILKAVASETGITLLMLCQLNRGIEDRPKFVPKMRDLRGAGQLEQDADVILFLCWPKLLDENRNPNEFLVFVGKNRNRAINTGCVKCEFNPTRQMLVSDTTRSHVNYVQQPQGKSRAVKEWDPDAELQGDMGF